MKNVEKPEYVRYLLKTPTGYLTHDGTTPDITCEDIIILTSESIGSIFSSKEVKIRKFFERSKSERFSSDECQILGYVCSSGPHSCAICGKINHCQLWKNRKHAILFKVC